MRSGGEEPPRARVRPEGSVRPARLVAVMLGVAMVCSTAVLVVAAPPAAAAEVCGPTTPHGSVRVVVVVDYGTVSGAPGPTSVRCLTLPEGSTGRDLLRARSAMLGTAPPRHAPSGLLCALDGWPAAPECGQATPDGYRYWSAWRGAGGVWEYASGNPFTRRLRDGDVEGWRFVAGAGNATDPPPRVAPDPAALFPAPPTPSPSPTEPRPHPPPGPTVPPGGSSVHAPATAPLAENDQGGTVPASPGHEAAPPPVAGQDTATDGQPDPGDTTAGRQQAGSPEPSPEAQATRDLAARAEAADGGGTPAAALVGLALVLLLGGLAVAVGRARGLR